jgi:hypothetical protein
VSGRILIDAYGYNKHHLALQRREGTDRKQNGNNSGAAGTDEQASENSAYIERLSDESQQKNKDEMLARAHDLIFLSPMLTGFSLKAKLWREYSALGL